MSTPESFQIPAQVGSFLVQNGIRLNTSNGDQSATPAPLFQMTSPRQSTLKRVNPNRYNFLSMYG